ncbi:Hypothetical protein NocV09_07400100, partial [Nannochloropsis oceanica]
GGRHSGGCSSQHSGGHPAQNYASLTGCGHRPLPLRLAGERHRQAWRRPLLLPFLLRFLFSCGSEGGREGG